jgi:hypothetical protein
VFAAVSDGGGGGDETVLKEQAENLAEVNLLYIRTPILIRP